MKKVSVIIPVYNSEKYIGRCLESVLNQTYSNFEIIVINDGSKDNSQKIIDEYKEKYPDKIISINQQNKGVAITRNESIKRATGKYIMFVDNDDFLDIDYIETFVNEAEKNDYDIVLGGYRRPNENGKIIKKLKLKDTEWSKLMITAPWAKIYKKDYLLKNKFEFLNTNIGEDVYFNLSAMLISNKIKIIPYIGYNWFYNTESISNTKQKNINKLQIYELLNSCYDSLKNRNLMNNHYEIIEAYFMRYIFWILTYTTKKQKYNIINEQYDKVFKWLKEKFPNYKKNKLIGFFKPKGELKSIRFATKIFYIFHSINLGKIFIYFYSKL